MKNKSKKIFVLSIMLFSLVSCQFNEGSSALNDSNTSSSEEIPTNTVTETFSVTWKNYDGSILEVDEQVIKGTIPTYDGNLPVKPSTNDYEYTFIGWSPNIIEVSNNAIYTAMFEESKIDLNILASHESGFYTTEFNLELESTKNATIYYTLDSSTPTKNSLKYNGPIQIKDFSSNPNVYSIKDNISSIDVFIPTQLVDKCVVLKAIAVDNNGEVSDMMCKTYFVGFDKKIGYDNLPIISLSLDPSDLYDYEKGIYVTGKMYDEKEHVGYPEQYPANYQESGKEWERVAFMTYFNQNKEFDFSQNLGVRIHGGWSRAFNQKSFNFYARKEYSGSKKFEKSFFDTEEMHTFMLRSGGYRDTFVTKTRDSLNHDMSANESFSVQNSYPCILFLNGEYWGIYNLQERLTEHYVQEHYGPDKDNVVIIKNDEVDEGEEEDISLYEDLFNFFKENTFESDEMYNKADELVDLKQFAEYMSTELYVNNIDWPGNNVRLWRVRETSDKAYEDGKWRFMLYDTDDSCNMVPSKCSYDSDPFINSTHWKYGPLDQRCILGLMLSKLICNEEFKTMFKQTFIRIGSENFKPEKVNSYLEEKEKLLKTPMVKFYQRFVSEDINKYNEAYFSNQINNIKVFYENRYEYAIKYLNQHII